METIHLTGAEEVAQAGRNISGAADTMQRASNNIEGSLANHRQFLDDWLGRFEEAIRLLREDG